MLESNAKVAGGPWRGKVNGVWKISLGDLLRKGGKTTEETMKGLRGSIDHVGLVTKRIESGTFTTAEEAAKAIGHAVPVPPRPGEL